MLLYAATRAQAPFGNSFSGAPICARRGPICQEERTGARRDVIGYVRGSFRWRNNAAPYLRSGDPAYRCARTRLATRRAIARRRDHGLLQTHTLRVHKAGAVLLWSVAAFGVATILFGISQSFWLSFAMLILVGAFDNISVILRHSLIQMETPDWVRGRVLAVNNIFISCSNQLGAVESGWAAALLGTVPSVVAGGFATTLVVAVFAARFRQLRHWKQ